jgi:hypothetical protein
MCWKRWSKNIYKSAIKKNFYSRNLTEEPSSRYSRFPEIICILAKDVNIYINTNISDPLENNSHVIIRNISFTYQSNWIRDLVTVLLFTLEFGLFKFSRTILTFDTSTLEKTVQMTARATGFFLNGNELCKLGGKQKWIFSWGEISLLYVQYVWGKYFLI